jgi:small subunit ribosomal protein S8
MCMTDPISDMLTRIRNALGANKPDVTMGASKLRQAIAKVLQEEGFIAGYSVNGAGAKAELNIALRYHEGKPAIEKVRRISTPGLRVYCGKDKLPKVMGGLGVALVSTSAGIMTDRAARKLGHGGEVLCYVQ